MSTAEVFGSVAAAELNGELQKFLEFFSKKQHISMFKLTTHGMPAGAGCKGGRAPKKKSHSSAQLTDENSVSLTYKQAF